MTKMQTVLTLATTLAILGAVPAAYAKPCAGPTDAQDKGDIGGSSSDPAKQPGKPAEKAQEAPATGQNKPTPDATD